MVRDVGLAEDLAQDAVMAALEQWPHSGVPVNPGAWLMQTAKHRAIDRLRRDARLGERNADAMRELEDRQRVAPDFAAAAADTIGDDVLRLVFMTCHPALSPDARVSLTLRLLGGLTTSEIARAFLTPEPAIAQRIVRAKRTLTNERAGFDELSGADRDARLASVLGVVYLIFNEGYAATAGEELMRTDLCAEALRLGRVLASIAPEVPDVHGLVALMEIQASRARARINANGDPILLPDQDRSAWDRTRIKRGLAALERAEALQSARGSYTLQAAIAAVHARAATYAATDWVRIAALYAELVNVVPSPIVELNRAVALAMAFGPERGLAAVDALVNEPALKTYHLLPSVRGDLLLRLGRAGEARAEFERAASMTANARERRLLLARAAACGDGDRGGPATGSG